jgi:hypothetical protein
MKKLPKEYVIVEIIPTHSNPQIGFIAQIQALKINNNQIINRLDLRVNEDLINNYDLQQMISYDKEMFNYVEKNDLIKMLIEFIGDIPLLIIDNDYTKDYLKNIKNKQESVFNYLDLKISNNVFNELVDKYKLEPSNHLVDLLYEALIFEKNDK